VRVGRQVLDLAAAAGGLRRTGPAHEHEGLARRGRCGDEAVCASSRRRRTRTRGVRRALLDEREIRYLPPIPDADKFLVRREELPHASRELKRNDLLTRRRQEPTVSSSSTLLERPQRAGRAARGHRPNRYHGPSRLRTSGTASFTYKGLF